jgi:soluble lytic murein transglycosylase
VRWYAYDALEGSNPHQVDALLRRAAAFYHLPANLVIAIARQESGFRQHVIAKDGGIGVMQLMPYTASWINTMTGAERDPYKLHDNIFMGVFYVHMLSDTFHWNTIKLISAYNEGPWAVTHQGVTNWNYVNNVLRLARSL